MKLTLLILMALVVCERQAAGEGLEFAAGRTSYASGEFRNAATHFQLATKAHPDDPEAWYWMVMSYQRLGDIAAPFGGKDNSKAREYLTKATQLAPGRISYRQALFDF